MGKSFILKDRMGMTAGYIFMGLGELRCRVSGAKAGMEAVLMDANGGCDSREMDATADEQIWEVPGRELGGAAIILNGEIIADTGVQARSSVRQMLESRKKREKEEKAQNERTETKQEISSDEENKRGQAADSRETEGGRTKETAACDLPQRRWPRPPCMQSAVYCEGKWVEEET